MSGENWVFQHDDDKELDEFPEWENRGGGQFLDDFLASRRPVTEYVHRVYSDPTVDAASLDYISSEGRHGLFSDRFVGVIRSYVEPSFSLLPAELNGHSFYFLRHEGSVDCLDYENSILKYFDDMNPTKVMSINRYSFRVEQLQKPLVFSLPGYFGGMFWTKPLVEICQEAGLTGIRFVPIDRINKNNGVIPPVWKTEDTDSA